MRSGRNAAIRASASEKLEERHHKQNECKAKPRQCILKVVIAEVQYGVPT
jgi:hypothetical protein